MIWQNMSLYSCNFETIHNILQMKSKFEYLDYEVHFEKLVLRLSQIKIKYWGGLEY